MTLTMPFFISFPVPVPPLSCSTVRSQPSHQETEVYSERLNMRSCTPPMMPSSSHQLPHFQDHSSWPHSALLADDTSIFLSIALYILR